MTDQQVIDFMGGVKTGATVLSDAAQIAAPIVSMYNPAAGLALSALAPVAEKFIMTEAGAIIIWKTNMTKDEMIAALNASKSINWGTPDSIEVVGK